jgi:hypothetical protein
MSDTRLDRQLFSSHPEKSDSFNVIRVGIFFAEVCAEVGTNDPATIADALMQQYPPESGWHWTLHCKPIHGTCYPTACNQFPHHRHYVFTLTGRR